MRSNYSLHECVHLCVRQPRITDVVLRCRVPAYAEISVLGIPSTSVFKASCTATSIGQS